MSNTQILEWKDEYSVKVKEIDDQHKELFRIINILITEVTTLKDEKKMKSIISDLVKYKMAHFATEEKYFKEFNYDGAEDHIQKHKAFSKGLEQITQDYKDDTIGLSFAIIDYLEDWLITHLMGTDHKYIQCFNSHGLH